MSVIIKYASLLGFSHHSGTALIRSGRQNPGNNLHVSGLSHKVDTRDLEAAFAKIGRVYQTILSQDILAYGFVN